jgi:hypothetical protein
VTIIPTQNRQTIENIAIFFDINLPSFLDKKSLITKPYLFPKNDLPAIAQLLCLLSIENIGF